MNRPWIRIAPLLALAACSPAASPSSTPSTQPASAGAQAAARGQGATPVNAGTTVQVAGYGSTVFVAHRDANRIDVLTDGTTHVLAQGEALGHPRVLVLSGGQLFVGGDDALRSVSLASGEITTVAEQVGPFVGLATDHIGYLAAAVDGRGLVRITPEGTVTQLAPGPIGPLAFEAGSRTLEVSDREVGQVVELDYLALLGEDAAKWAARDARPMKPFEIDGIALSGAEYWPYKGDKEPDYPQDVLWGFYPEEGVVFEGDRSPASANPKAVACAERSYQALRTWVDEAPVDFRKAVELGASPRFYLWVNDYSEANKPFGQDVRPNRFWYWERKPAVVGRVPGYWKWETTLTQDGECLIPDPAQIEEYLAERIADAAQAG